MYYWPVFLFENFSTDCKFSVSYIGHVRDVFISRLSKSSVIFYGKKWNLTKDYSLY